jgi:hypothetical protein
MGSIAATRSAGLTPDRDRIVRPVRVMHRRPPAATLSLGYPEPAPGTPPGWWPLVFENGPGGLPT